MKAQEDEFVKVLSWDSRVLCVWVRVVLIHGLYLPGSTLLVLPDTPPHPPF